ncbi:hypothetical protein CMEL01_02682 [Colletotrichum melonis]|uniref:Uncharacterized protein n=1 Tax=Colletotrichum melonis TaxID=1209925 RepID=A0AAI9XU28_9PEZI|nr:hypothetical protein CMEL01_02682 [Colletotrichum melonis]
MRTRANETRINAFPDTEPSPVSPFSLPNSPPPGIYGPWGISPLPPSFSQGPNVVIAFGPATIPRTLCLFFLIAVGTSIQPTNPRRNFWPIVLAGPIPESYPSTKGSQPRANCTPLVPLERVSSPPFSTSPSAQPRPALLLVRSWLPCTSPQFMSNWIT